MEYQNIPLSCECGRVPRFVSSFGLTANHQLLIHWRCTQCRRDVYFLKALSDCWRDCPPEAIGRSDSTEITPDDRKFLRRLRVKDPDE
jgi:hypothetical protein